MLANRKIFVGEVEIFTCLLFGEKPVRDGSNFVRLDKCKEADI